MKICLNYLNANGEIVIRKFNMEGGVLENREERYIQGESSFLFLCDKL